MSSVKDYGTTSAYTNYTYDKNGNQTKVEKYSRNNNGRFKLDIVNIVYGIENAGTENPFKTFDWVKSNAVHCWILGMI